MHGARSVPRASSAERVLLVPEPGKPVVASFALEIPLVIRPLGACCNSRSLKSGRKRKKRPTHESRFPLRPRPTATPWPVPWLAKAMAELRHAIGIDRRRTRAQVVQPPCSSRVTGLTHAGPATVCVCVCVWLCAVCVITLLFILWGTRIVVHMTEMDDVQTLTLRVLVIIIHM